ncbi:MAG TPA: CDP-alcohol phosphatidyltransferase family protein [Thermoleophilaceae bacterium]
MARARLTKARLLGLDRSGGPPPQTRRGAPLNPWTIPNAIGFVRLGLLPVFLVLAFNSGDGRSVTAAVIYAVVGGTDYLDGIAARVTGQYSRLGALLDPLTDRVLVASGAIVCWYFELLPRWALAVLAIRELVMLFLGQAVLRRGLDIEINMLGRWGVWPTMFSLFLAMLTDTWVADGLLFVGVAMSIAATLQYVRDYSSDPPGAPSSSS